VLHVLAVKCGRANGPHRVSANSRLYVCGREKLPGYSHFGAAALLHPAQRHVHGHNGMFVERVFFVLYVGE
jgi:hypothetical protein